jgi:L-alanine-DL-glutamate epimerase-like enolase superfamily enzyme
MMLNRRAVMAGLAGMSAGALWAPLSAEALGLPTDRIKRIRYFKTPTDAAGRPNIHQPTFNQSTNIVLIETESGLVGIGEGGEPSSMEQCAGLLIGEDPFRIEHAWQVMYRGYFYPAGREKTHSLGALDVALWDLKGKALGVPVWQLLGGKSRDHVECYATSYPTPKGGTIEDAARACIAEGFRAYRFGPRTSREWDRFQAVEDTIKLCELARKGAGHDGGWAIDFHGEFEPSDAITLANAIEPFRPYFVEDLIRSEMQDVYKHLRAATRVPIAYGEVLGAKWDINAMIEQNLIDYARVTVPNVGGITEYMKIQALAETHDVGMIPHFTGPVGETALVHCLTASSIPALMEMTSSGRRPWPYLPEAYDFHDGKLWPNDRPGLGITLDAGKLEQVGDYSERYTPIPMDHRPDGTYTNW